MRAAGAVSSQIPRRQRAQAVQDRRAEEVHRRSHHRDRASRLVADRGRGQAVAQARSFRAALIKRTSMANKRFAVFDSDSHVVEPPELWSKYLDPEFRTLGKFALWREEGKLGSYLKVNGKVVRDTMNSNIPRHAIWRPGMTWDKVGELDADTRHAATAGASNAEARLRVMDAMGIDQALLYPTWFAEGFHLVEDPDVAYALARAYNDW